MSGTSAFFHVGLLLVVWTTAKIVSTSVPIAINESEGRSTKFVENDDKYTYDIITKIRQDHVFYLIFSIYSTILVLISVMINS